MDMEYNIKVMHAMRANFRFVELRGSHGAIHGCCTQPYPGYMSIRQNYGMTKVVLSGLVVCRHSPNLHNR